jgi:hypothetical protein
VFAPALSSRSKQNLGAEHSCRACPLLALGDVRAQLGANVLESSSERVGQAREASRRGSYYQGAEHYVFDETLSGLIIVKLLKSLNQGFH